MKYLRVKGHNAHHLPSRDSGESHERTARVHTYVCTYNMHTRREEMVKQWGTLLTMGDSGKGIRTFSVPLHFLNPSETLKLLPNKKSRKNPETSREDLELLGRVLSSPILPAIPILTL